MVFVPMRHEDGVDMVDIVANQRRHHALIEPTVDERYGATLTNQNRIGLANIEDRYRRRCVSIPIDIRNTRCKLKHNSPTAMGRAQGRGHQTKRTASANGTTYTKGVPGGTLTDAPGTAAKSCSKNRAQRATIMGTTSAP